MIDITRYTDHTAEEGLTYRTLDITPEIAAEWLGANLNNRRKKIHRIPGYVRDMIEGRWKLDGSAIRFSADGTLLDGQNRLFSVIEAGATIRSTVIGGLPADAQKVMDTGSARNLADHLGMIGVPNSTSAASVAGFLCRWERGVRRAVSRSTGEQNATLGESNAMYWSREEEIHAAIRETRNAAKHPGMLSNSVLAAAFIILSEIDKTDADEFIRLLGLPVADIPSSKHPVAALLSALQRDHDARSSRNSDWRLGMFFKAWNAWRDGYEATHLRYSPGGAKREKFPEPV